MGGGGGDGDVKAVHTSTGNSPDISTRAQTRPQHDMGFSGISGARTQRWRLR